MSSFGIRPEDDYAYYELRRQPVCLFESRDEKYELTEFVVDLDCTSRPNQIVLAVVKPKPTLAEMFDAVEKKIAAWGSNQNVENFGSNDVLLVPDIVWRISHRFTELEGKIITNSDLKGRRIDVARQDTEFLLNRSGVELKSESKTYELPIATYYIFNRPFLLFMKKRGAEMPYFVMWVENAELLNKWQLDGKPPK